jgi:hypothetical protein
MATLSYTDDDDVQADQRESVLTWHWATWPSNLRRAVITTVAVMAATAASVAMLQWADKDLGRKLKVQTDLRLASQNTLKNSDQERRDIEANLPLLRKLEAAGIFGEEKRLEWIELLRVIEKRWPGVRIQYAISAQQLQNKTPQPGIPIATAAPAVTTLPSGETAKAFGQFHTDMKLTLSLLHEGDALAIIDELKAAQLGHFTVRKCSFKRMNSDLAGGNATGAAAVGRPLDAECQLTWISMRTYAPT